MIETTEQGGRVVEPIEWTNAVAVRDAGARLLAQADREEVLIDMSAVAANSIALAVAVSWLSVARELKRKMRLTNLSDEFIDVIEFSGMAELFPST